MHSKAILVTLLLTFLAVSYGNGAVLDQITKINLAEKQKFSSSVPDIREGDIVVTDRLRMEIDKLNLTAYGFSAFDAIRNGKWPGAHIAYSFDRRFNQAGRRSVMSAIDEYHRNTCIRFKPRKSTDRNYIQFFHGSGCYSMIGVQGGMQRVSLGNGCTVKGIAVHEIMHALGFYHEQSRIDRDSQIIVYTRNIISGMGYNFAKYRPGAASTLNEPYDKSSIMHYGNYAFSRNGQKTIVSKSNPNERLGQRNGLSKIDIRQLNKYYNCKTTTITPTKKPTTTCKDSYTFCPDLKARWCGHTWVKTNCKSSCKACTTTKTCRDKDSRCRSWAAFYCRDSKHGPYMRTNCEKSCRFC